MTAAEVIAKWPDACDAIELKGDVVRNGNWHPTSRVLRHFTSEASASIELVAELGSTAILKITPADAKPLPGKTVSKRPAFLLLVK